jgi:7-cyano-7-deazaguanine reductase
MKIERSKEWWLNMADKEEGSVSAGVDIIRETESSEVAATLLGQRVSAPTTYTPDILVAVPRDLNRVQYGITNDTLKGADDWYCYECSTLTARGLPVYFGLIISYDAHSHSIVESKSLKLYLNSFNMERMGDTIEEAKANYCARVKRDLSKLLGVSIAIHEFTDTTFHKNFDEYRDLLTLVDQSRINLSAFNEAPGLLTTNIQYKNIAWKFSGLRSNCRVTHQPDWATVLIKMSGGEGIDPEGLLGYLSSFRNESHFHEECAEMIFKRLVDKYVPTKLFVRCCYTRRGGIDINPWRSLQRTYPDYARTVYQ